ncbi:MAG: PH domain-containing protein [Actinobacteria bacterium]|nr:PH domain-containing protein [Actinomycetota bacterium]
MPSEPPNLPQPPAGPARSYPPHPVPPGYPPGHPATQPGLTGDTQERPPEIGAPPKRTSPLTIGINIVAALFVIVVALPQLLAPQSTSSKGSGPPSYFVFVLVAVVAIQLVGGTLTWFARTYTISARELVIDEGILGRRRKVVPFARVQQVDINQRLVQQVVNVATLRIDTAGEAGGSSIKLGLLDVKLARGMRSYILSRRAELQGTLRAPRPVSQTASTPAIATPAIATPVAAEVPLLHLSPGRLALAGATHHTVVLSIPVLLIAGLWGGAFVSITDNKLSVAAVFGVSMVLVLSLGLFLIMMGLLQYTLGQFGFTLAEQGDDLHLRYGLLEVRNLTIPRRRVQHITIVDNPVRRALGVVAIYLHSAAPLGGIEGHGAGSTRFEIPILARRDLDQFLHALMGGDWHVPPLTPRNASAKRRAITRRTMFLALAITPPAIMLRPASLALYAVALLGIPWGALAHRRAGFAETPEIVVLSHGALRHHVDLLPYSRVQSCTAEQNPLQRAAKLLTLHVNVAGPSTDPHLYDMPAGAAAAYLADLPRQSVNRG